MSNPTAIIILFLITSGISEDLQRIETHHCRERDRPITTDKEDYCDVIDAILEQKLILQCHFCNENDDGRPKNWYKTERIGLTNATEVELGMENENKRNRIQVNTEHSLIIDNFNWNDTGVYSCVRFEDNSNKDKLNYLVDVVFSDETPTVEKGNLTAWSKYHDEYFSPINKLFASSQGSEYRYIRETLGINFELVSRWQPWSKCEVCGRPAGDGIKKKKGLCHLKLSPYRPADNRTTNDETYLYRAPSISCRSQLLHRLFPEVSNVTRVIPDFVQDDRCAGECNPDAEGVNKGWKVGKSKGFKYRRIFVLQEGQHLTLICPESTLDNLVVWSKSGKKLKRGDNSNPHVVMDTFSTLYLIDVTSADAGNYTCQVDDVKMQQVVVHVYSKSRLLTKEMGRYFLYLGFILFLTSFCYCAGLVVTCQRRFTFKSYEELREEFPEDDDFD